ncbi:MAG: hypothetical protein K0Q91_1718 [Fibrobacteria bacterium]|jgi:hypothetical protein|nr:hypothetical protein [Fibrobacteria bacterium]
MSDAHNHTGHGTHSEGAHEKSDLNYQPMLWIIPASLAFLLLFVTVIVYLSAAAASDEMNRKQFGSADAGRAQLEALRAQEDSVLNGSGTDADGRVRVPVSTAMEALPTSKNP